MKECPFVDSTNGIVTVVELKHLQWNAPEKIVTTALGPTHIIIQRLEGGSLKVFWASEILAKGIFWVYVDRKSTRLNSSHANISYAVFCLKKKKI